MFGKIKDFLNLVLNKLPVINLLDGKKTIIAAALVAIAEMLSQISPVFPLDKQAVIMAAVESLRVIAGYLGAAGIVGKAVKEPEDEKFIVSSTETKGNYLAQKKTDEIA